MRNKILPILLFLFCFGGIIHAQNTAGVFHGLKIIKDHQQHFFIANEHDVHLLTMDSIQFNIDSVIAEINHSQISDRMLIVRVLQMHSDPAEKRTELLNMTQTYPEIAIMILRRAEADLQKRYSPQELETMKQRKK